MPESLLLVCWQSEIATDTLSPGEQQSISLARVLYHRPQLTIMDEATSALNEESEVSPPQRLSWSLTHKCVSHRGAA